MADYYPVLARAIAGLDQNSTEARRAIYERARTALVRQLRSYDPPLTESEIARERVALEETIRKLDAEQRALARAEAARGAAPPSSPPPPAAAPPPHHPAPKPLASPGRAPAFLRTPDAPRHVEPAAAETVGPPLAPEAGRDLRAPARPEPRGPEPRDDAADHRGHTRFAPPGEEPREEPDVSAETIETEDAEPRRSRAPAIIAATVVILLGAVAAGAYVARDELTTLLGSENAPRRTATAEPAQRPKINDRIGDGSTAAPTQPPPRTPIANPPASAAATAAEEQLAAASPSQAAPAAGTAAPAAEPGATAPSALVAQRAILYEEAPDKQGGSAHAGTATWVHETVMVNQRPESQLRATISIPERQMQVKLTIRRNLDGTLSASHTIDIQFELPDGFSNGGVANVPGILFKTSEEAGGSALAGLSVKVMSGFFLIGLSNQPAERAQNVILLRDGGWIDLPILYENGRRAVLTIEKGTPGERAFQEAFAAWNANPPVAQNQGPQKP